jgi:hypothetical protein
MRADATAIGSLNAAVRGCISGTPVTMAALGAAGISLAVQQHMSVAGASCSWQFAIAAVREQTGCANSAHTYSGKLFIPSNTTIAYTTNRETLITIVTSTSTTHANNIGV